MLEELKLKNVGPALEMNLQLAERLNLITGDNGLGKSFVLDVAWWALTRSWAGHVVRPSLETIKKKQPATIYFRYEGSAKKREFTSTYVPEDTDWSEGRGRPANPGLVIYARVDGGFAVWDPFRNQKSSKPEVPIPPDAFLFSPEQVWDGLPAVEGRWACNGLVRDWVTWQLGKGRPFTALTKALETMSEPGWVLRPGSEPARLPHDSRQIPTIESHGELVPILVASAAVRRITALVYLMVWAWEEHVIAAEARGLEPIDRVIFLVDEPECHLHPRWQRRVVPALLEVVGALASDASVQLIASTHSPLVLASVEPSFDPMNDAWFDLDLNRELTPPRPELIRRDFVAHGDVSKWLTSQAFDLASARSLPSEEAIRKAHELLLEVGNPRKVGDGFKYRLTAAQRRKANAIDEELHRVGMSEIDPFWVRWGRFMQDLGER